MNLTKTQLCLHEALTNIAPEYIEKAYNKPVRPVAQILKRVVAVAATIALLIGVPILWRSFAPGFSSGNLLNPVPDSFFAVSVNASETGTRHWLPPENMVMSSLTPVPEFTGKTVWSMGIRPENTLNLNVQEYYQKYRISISCNGEPVEGYFDNGFIILRRCYFSDLLPYGFTLYGWVDGAADLTITLTDENGTVLQEQTLRITYLENEDDYSIETIDFYMLETE